MSPTAQRAAELTISAHGVGGQQDLPISLSLAVFGAVAALIASFLVLALAWGSSRYDSTVEQRAGSGLPVVGKRAPERLNRFVRSRVLRWTVRALGLALFVYTVVVAVFGQNLLTNPLFGIFYVWLWIGIVPLSFLFGPFYRSISPVRSIHSGIARVSGRDASQGILDYPARFGYFPAALGLFAFVWIELVSKSATELSAVRLWGVAYVAMMLVGGSIFGDRWFERADPFEVYSTLVGKMSIWATDGDGRLLVRSPLANLASTPVAPGLTMVVGVLFGSTGFDSFRGSPQWFDFVRSANLSGYLLNNLALIVFCLGATGIFAAGSSLTFATGMRRRALPDRLAHSVVPIIFGYIIAHYLTYFIEAGQRTLIQFSDPFSDGSNYFGTGDFSIDYSLAAQQSWVASIKVVAVVIGHVVGVVAAHDRATAILSQRHRFTGQLPLVLTMVGFTAGGLLLLFSA